MNEIREKLQEDKIFYELLKNIKQSPNIWYNACFFLNELIGFENLNPHEEDLMDFYWQSLLLLHQFRINLDNCQQLYDKKLFRRALCEFMEAKDNHQNVVTAVALSLSDTGEANDN